MKTRYVTITIPLQIAATVGKSCDFEDEIETVKYPTLCLDDCDLDLSEFTNGKDESIIDVLVQKHIQSLEREVEKEEREFQSEAKKDKAWEYYMKEC